jgi:hypothetical protein
MQLASVLLARYYGLIQIEDLNRDGTVYYPELTSALVERYGFMKYPTSASDFDENKGIEFIGGRFNRWVIDKLVIVNSGVYLDTSVNTEASRSLWFDMMGWAVSTFGVTFKPEMIKRSVYVSNVTFHTDVPILAAHPIFAEIGNATTAEVENAYKHRLDYEPAAINITFDQTSIKLGTAPFTIQRREGVPFEENKYFSTAPLRTEVHLELLERWERAMTR